MLTAQHPKEPLLERGISLKDAAASERHGLGAGLLHAAHGHAHMLGFHEHNRSLGSEIIHEGIGNLCAQLLLQLQTTGVDLNRAGKLREPCDTAVGDITNGGLAIKRQQMRAR